MVNYYENRCVFNKDLKISSEGAALISKDKLNIPQVGWCNREGAFTPGQTFRTWNMKFQHIHVHVPV